MNSYRVIFTGRKINAIGMSDFCVLDVEAESPDAALLKCYDTHEHIYNPTVIDLTTNKRVALKDR